jgi:uncharacterized membrane protein
VQERIKKLRAKGLLRPENIFVVIALLFGLVLTFVIPPLHGNDEIVHFPRAYDVQQGHLQSEHLGGYDYGAYVPAQIKQYNDAYREQVQNSQPDSVRLAEIRQQYDAEKLTGKSKEPLAFTSASVYSAWAYAPQAIGIFIAKLLDLPLNWYVYVGRIFVLLAYIVLTYFAIRLMPFGKVFLVVVALLPTAVTQSVTLGMDGLVNGLSWLIIALTLAIFTQRIKVSSKILALILLLSLFLATTKQTYAPIAVLPLLIPARLYPFAYKKVWAWRAAFGAALVGVSLWYISATSPVNEIMHFIQRPGLYINEADQLHYVFQHPLQFLGMIFSQPLPIWSAHTYAGVVGVMTNRMLLLPIVVIVLLLTTLAVTVFHKERLHIASRDKLFVVSGSMIALVATFILINLALYLSFTRVGHPRVEGIQGRYFLPLLPLVGIVLHVLMPRFALRLSNAAVYLIAATGVAVGLISAIIVIA